LLVVSHDRYFLERVTDQQFAVLHGRLRHLPGGVDEYLRLRAAEAGSPAPTAPRPAVDGSTAGPAKLSGADLRAAQKELTATERRLDKLASQVATAHKDLEVHDPADYDGILRLTKQVGELEAEIAAVEERWLELSDQVG
jgi:ATPase subunit of ABC transporter with duplicated ATPase domains